MTHTGLTMMRVRSRERCLKGKRPMCLHKRQNSNSLNSRFPSSNPLLKSPSLFLRPRLPKFPKGILITQISQGQGDECMFQSPLPPNTQNSALCRRGSPARFGTAWRCERSPVHSASSFGQAKLFEARYPVQVASRESQMKSHHLGVCPILTLP